MWNLRAKAFFLAFLLGHAGAATADAPSNAWVEATQEDGMVRVEVFAKLDPGVAGTYEMSVAKSGTSGTSKSRQAGRVPLSEDGAIVGPLTVSRMSLEAGALLTVDLKITTENGVVFVDAIEIAGE